jgi:hypothetical protein
VQSEAGDHAKFVVTGIASAYLFGAMKIRPLSTGFVIPAQPVKSFKTAGWDRLGPAQSHKAAGIINSGSSGNRVGDFEGS